MVEKTACVTGHRALSGTHIPHLARRLDETIAELVSQGVIFYGIGMAKGFDTLAAQAVLRAREKNSTVKFIAVLPCANQDERWSARDKQTYRQLLSAANKIVHVSSQPYADGCMADRNLHLVKHSSVCIAYMKHRRSGTAQTVRFAQERGLTIINLAE
ncbi:DUF1273 domain-containing protein [Ruminococcaceae bacterium OttesenSCG-928-L11]|nr:DUF1273 domain-containing protein [Ruminococcaceae bacterium OttesenSCG-928-L11]